MDERKLVRIIETLYRHYNVLNGTVWTMQIDLSALRSELQVEKASLQLLVESVLLLTDVMEPTLKGTTTMVNVLESIHSVRERVMAARNRLLAPDPDTRFVTEQRMSSGESTDHRPTQPTSFNGLETS